MVLGAAISSKVKVKVKAWLGNYLLSDR